MLPHVWTAGCDCVKCWVWDRGYHRWRRDFHSHTTACCRYSHPGDGKTTAAVKQGMCSAVRAVVESALENATCDSLHSYAQRAQSLPSSFSLRQLSKVKSLLFPKISKQNIYLMTCMNEWLSCMENLIPSFATSNINVLIVFTLQGYAVSEMDCSKQMSWHFHVFFPPWKLPRSSCHGTHYEILTQRRPNAKLGFDDQSTSCELDYLS